MAEEIDTWARAESVAHDYVTMLFPEFDVLPMCAFIICSPNQLGICRIPSGMPKDVTALVIRNILQDRQAVGYVLVMEAWIAEVKGKEINMSDIPLDDKSEIIMISSIVKGGPVSCETAKIHHTTAGRKLGNFEKSPYQGYEGRFIIKDW